MKLRAGFYAVIMVYASFIGFADAQKGGKPGGGPKLILNETFNYGFDLQWTADPALQITYNDATAILTQDGSPAFRFIVDGNSTVARFLAEEQPLLSRWGIRSAKTVPTGIVAEARVKMPAGSIETPFELALVSAADPTKFVSARINAGCYGNCRFLITNDDATTPNVRTPFDYDDETWYRLRLTDDPVNGLEASVWNDAGTSKLVAFSFNATLSNWGTAFHVILGQCSGIASPPYLLSALVDQVTVKAL